MLPQYIEFNCTTKERNLYRLLTNPRNHSGLSFQRIGRELGYSTEYSEDDKALSRLISKLKKHLRKENAPELLVNDMQRKVYIICNYSDTRLEHILPIKIENIRKHVNAQNATKRYYEGFLT